MDQIYKSLGVDHPGVVVLDEREIAALFALEKRGWSIKAMAKELGWSRNTVRGWLRRGEMAERPVVGRPKKLADEEVWLQEEFKAGTRNGDVLRQELAKKGVRVGLRTVERAVQKLRQEIRCAETATLRFETDPGQQLQIDFGEKWIVVTEARVKVFVFVATLGFSRRTFARVYPGMRQMHWLEGLEAALRHFGGATDECLVDNAKALVLEWKGDVPHYHPEFEAFCRHWGMRPRACRPYHARTKGKVESGVKYVKHNALGRRSYESWEALHAHMDWWMAEIADQRIHGTTHERPIDRFEREKDALMPLGSHISYLKVRRFKRKVHGDCHVDVDTNHYSVPHYLVGQEVHLVIVAGGMTAFWHGDPVAEHSLLPGRHGRVTVPSHLDGLVRKTYGLPEPNELQRPLSDYAAAVGE
jgi:transposase